VLATYSSVVGAVASIAAGIHDYQAGASLAATLLDFTGAFGGIAQLTELFRAEQLAQDGLDLAGSGNVDASLTSS